MNVLHDWNLKANNAPSYISFFRSTFPSFLLPFFLPSFLPFFLSFVFHFSFPFTTPGPIPPQQNSGNLLAAIKEPSGPLLLSLPPAGTSSSLSLPSLPSARIRWKTNLNTPQHTYAIVEVKRKRQNIVLIFQNDHSKLRILVYSRLENQRIWPLVVTATI